MWTPTGDRVSQSDHEAHTRASKDGGWPYLRHSWRQRILRVAIRVEGCAGTGGVGARDGTALAGGRLQRPSAYRIGKHTVTPGKATRLPYRPENRAPPWQLYRVRRRFYGKD